MEGNVLVQGGIGEMGLADVLARLASPSKGFNICGIERSLLGGLGGGRFIELKILKTGLLGLADTLAEYDRRSCSRRSERGSSCDSQ